MYKCSCGYATEKGNAYSAHFSHHKGDEHKKLGWEDPVTKTLYPTRPTAAEAKKAAKTPAAEPKPVPQGTVPAVALLSARPPILFDLGQEKIALNFQDLYDAYKYYDDLVKEVGLTSEFAETILACVKDRWKSMRTEARIENGQIVVEVSNADHR